MNYRRATIALLTSGLLAIAACGHRADDSSTKDHAAIAAAESSATSAWRVYYDLTHPDRARIAKPSGSDPTSAWRVYYDLTHPDRARIAKPTGSDPTSAWRVYYDLTHPSGIPPKRGGIIYEEW
jgi:hypothetical protein